MPAASALAGDDFLRPLTWRVGLPPRRQPAAPVAGQRVGAHRLTHELGRGGSAVVWRAEPLHAAAGGPVAIKLPWPGVPAALARRRFAHEAALLAGLHHPNVAGLREAGTDAQGRPFLALELVDGAAITAHAQAQGLSLCERLRLMLQVMDAVDALHRAHRVHSDLKPANVLVTRQGQVKLIDFGIARRLRAPAAGPGADPDPGPGANLGTDPGLGTDPDLGIAAALTPAYASPERLLGAAAGVDADVYALGVLLHELLTGRHPHAPSAAPRAVLAQAKRGARVAVAAELVAGARQRGEPGGDAPGFPRWCSRLNAVLAAALHRDPARRPANVSALADAVQHATAQRPPATGRRRASHPGRMGQVAGGLT